MTKSKEQDTNLEMKDKNGIEICCENCRCVCKYDSMCLAHTPPSFFRPASEALEARIAELQEHNDILQKRVQEISMELLDYNMKENKDVLERIKEYEENFDKNTLTQSTESGTFNRVKTRDVSWGEIAKRIKSAFDRGQEDSSVCKTILDIFSLWAQAYECHFCRTLESLDFFSDEEMYRIDKHVTHRKNSCKRDLYEYCAITEAAREIISGNENNKK